MQEEEEEEVVECLLPSSPLMKFLLGRGNIFKPEKFISQVKERYFTFIFISEQVARHLTIVRSFGFR